MCARNSFKKDEKVAGREVKSGCHASAHRGDSGAAPENTIPALRAAVGKGAKQVEFDVYLSADGQPVVIHDSTVDRTTDGSGSVAEMTFKDLRSLDAGSWFSSEFAGVRIPTLSEALEAVPAGTQCNVQIKHGAGVAAVVADAVKDMGRLSDAFLHAGLSHAEEARGAVSEILICNASNSGYSRDQYVDSTIENGCEFIQLQRSRGLEGIEKAVERLHAAGVIVNFFHSEDPDEIRMLAEAGVDYILTDKLELCRKTLAEYRISD